MRSQYLCKASKPCCLFFLLLIFFLLFLSYGSTTAAADGKSTTIIGVVIDEDSRAGKEQKIAIKIAAQNFNNNSTNHELTFHFRNISSGNPLQTATTADQLITAEKVQVLIVSQTWQEAAIVADVGNRAQVPVVSLASSEISPTLTHVRWPFLIQMASNSSKEMESVAAIVHSYKWKKVVVIYEDDACGDPGTLAVLSQALNGNGSEIEYNLVLPPYYSSSNPQGFIGDEVVKLLSRKSRVYIVLKSSVRMARHLFREAKRIGLMGADSVWIVTDSITSVLDSSDPSFVTSMGGAIGTKSYYSEETSSFKELKTQFREIMKSDYPEEDNLVPGVHALRAYDSIMAISQAVTRLGSHENTTSKTLLKGILSSKFLGLSGKISFSDGSLMDSSNIGIINVVGKSYKELGFWLPELGFFKNVDQISNFTHSMQKLGGVVTWPGDLSRVPKGWTMPSDAKKMRIGVPGRTAFEKFVKVDETVDDNSKYGKKYSGFCIDVFFEVKNILEKSYPLPYEFITFNEDSDGLYDDLVLGLTDQRNESFDAVVGDITILANRSKYVEFTQPFAESGLSMMVQYKHEPSKAWLFLKPFSPNMWLATFGILFYTMFIVWSFERKSNPEFEGPFRDQLVMALWFTFSTMFFAHREKVYSNFTKMVVVVWLFVVLVLTSSYTASLSSMLTVQRLEPKVKDIETINKTNAVVGCDGDSFVKDYLTNVLGLKHIKTIRNQTDYPSEFEKGNIAAAFLELPYQKVFMQEYCNQYTTVGPTYRFGGLGFAFQKGSPIARDVSEAILIISENGVLKGLERKWFPSSKNCSASTNTDSLTIESFWGIYLISGVTSTVCLLIFIAKVLVLRVNKDQNQRNQESGDIPTEEGNWRKATALVRYIRNNNNRISPVRRTPSFYRGEEMGSSRWELVSPSEARGIRQPEIRIPEHSSRPPDIQIPIPNLDSIVYYEE
ncbi:Glutamate receptor [Heracleum sosnowskyi]|uniref:Glutamate receptor n=1 Tax=Heracleum sosnowskyi TaxID=360622 RepID=A0AAD8MRC7_9APIA|nr:Glutamate receptor [Heracleum sosnowskyi]